MPIGVPELLVVLVIVLVIFGPKRLPQLGRQLGSGMREFRNSVLGRDRDDDDDDDARIPHAELVEETESTASAPAAAGPRAAGDEPDEPRRG